MHVELSIHFKLKEGQDKGGEFLHLCRYLLVYVFIKVMNDELFSDLILSRKTRDFDVFGCPFTIFFARCYVLDICPLIHNILCPLSSPVEIVDSILLPVEVNNSYRVRGVSLK